MDLTKYKIKKSKITNERQLLIKDFLDTLNQYRKPPYKPLTPTRVGMMLRFCSNSELKTFYARCKEANNFYKYFFWSMKQ